MGLFKVNSIEFSEIDTKPKKEISQIPKMLKVIIPNVKIFTIR